MFKALTIKARVIMMVVVIFIVSSVLMALIIYQSQISYLKSTLQSKAESDIRLFPSQVAADAEGLAKALAGFTVVENFLKPFAEKNPAALLAQAKPKFEEIKAKYRITHMYFIEPNGKVLLRVHKPEQYGDTLERVTFKNAAATGKPAMGIEMGKNFFSLRAVQPVSYKGINIGYMELGEEIEHIFKQIKEISGDEVSVFLTEEFIKSKSAELRRDKIGEFTLLESTDKDMVLMLAEKVDMKRGLKEPAIIDVDVKGAKYLVALAPLKDAAGETAGVLFFQKDVSSNYAVIWRSIIFNVAAFSGILILAVIVFYWSIRNSVALFNKLIEAARRLARGELEVEIEVKCMDEVGILAKTFKEMVLRLKGIIAEIKSGSEQISAFAAQIASTSEQAARNNESTALVVEETTAAMQGISGNIQNVAKNTQNEAASVSSTSAAIEQMTISIQRIAATAQRLLELSLQTKEAVSLGLESVDKSVKGTDEISGAIMRSAETIAALGEKTEEIGKIVDVIDDLAEQTNLLALNAAIEAARAGEQGLGFAVVAEEVRKLAERSAKSTREITELIKGIQKEAKEAVKLMDKSTHTVEKGLQLSRQVGESLINIEVSVEEVDRYAKEIGAATQEQSSGSTHIEKAAESLREVTQEIMAAAQEQACGAEEVAKAMEMLRQMTRQNVSGTVLLATSSEALKTQAEKFQQIVDKFVMDGHGKGDNSCLNHKFK